MRDSNPLRRRKRTSVLLAVIVLLCTVWWKSPGVQFLHLQPSWTPKTVRLVGTLNISFLIGNISSVDKELYGEYPVPFT